MRYSQNQILALFYILLLSSCSDKDPTRELHISQLSQLALEHNMVLNINDSLTDDMSNYKKIDNIDELREYLDDNKIKKYNSPREKVLLNRSRYCPEYTGTYSGSYPLGAYSTLHFYITFTQGKPTAYRNSVSGFSFSRYTSNSFSMTRQNNSTTKFESFGTRSLGINFFELRAEYSERLKWELEAPCSQNGILRIKRSKP